MFYDVLLKRFCWFSNLKVKITPTSQDHRSVISLPRLSKSSGGPECRPILQRFDSKTWSRPRSRPHLLWDKIYWETTAPGVEVHSVSGSCMNWCCNWQDGLPAVCLYDAAGKQQQTADFSWCNEMETQFVSELVSWLTSGGVCETQIGVMTTYRAQVFRIKTLLSR